MGWYPTVRESTGNGPLEAVPSDGAARRKLEPVNHRMPVISTFSTFITYELKLDISKVH